MLTGTVPYNGNNYADLVVKIVTGNARPIRELDPKLSSTLERITMRAMACVRDDRFASVADFARDLRARRTGAPASIEARISIQAVPQQSTPFASELNSLPPRPPQQKTLQRVIVGLAAAVVAVGALWLFWPEGSEPAAPPVAAGQPVLAAPPAEPAPAPPAEPAKIALPQAPAAMPSPKPATPTPVAPVAAKPAPAPSAAPSPTTPEPSAEQAARDKAARDARKKREAEAAASPERKAAPAGGRRVPSEIIDPFQ
jgi:hypothetical protein